MTRSGFTLLELMVVVALIGVITVIGLPKIRNALQKTNVRSARVATSTYVATARQAAIQRGCRGVVHFSPGSAGTVWVTVCPRMTVGGSGTIDTLGVVSKLGTLYNVTMSETRDSVDFDPRGLSLTGTQSSVSFAGTDGSRDSIVINVLGKVVH
jgi:prepilin-type N-terminal cleavage/methylation domain-containing protein